MFDDSLPTGPFVSITKWIQDNLYSLEDMAII